MQFRQCSINGKLYIEDKGEFTRAYEAEAKLLVCKCSMHLKTSLLEEHILPNIRVLQIF